MSRNFLLIGIGILLGISIGAGVLMIQANVQYSVENIAAIPTPTPTEAPEYNASFLAVGDIMLSRGVDQAIRKKKNPLLPFEKMADVFTSVDFTFGNFEAPINGTDFAGKNGSLVFNVPVKNLEGLKKYNFEVLSLANNHALDQGRTGLQNTEKTLSDQGFITVGTGENLEDAWNPKIITKNGIRIAFISASYASYNDNGVRKNDWVARIEDTERLKTAIESAKERADFVVVAMHAGVEYTRTPNKAQIAFAHASIDYGADIVIGGHPHWIQTTEEYKGKQILYSLGNFIFDQEWSKDTKEGLAVKISLWKKGDKKELKISEYIPVIIENYSTPRKANPEEAKKILEKIGL